VDIFSFLAGEVSKHWKVSTGFVQRVEARAAEIPTPGNVGSGLLLAEGQLLFGIDPLLKYDLAVFALADVHGVCTAFQFFRHLLIHVDADSFATFADWIGCHK
jgi:hypothetical protein